MKGRKENGFNFLKVIYDNYSPRKAKAVRKQGYMHICAFKTCMGIWKKVAKMQLRWYKP